jgi:hypothetical protein
MAEKRESESLEMRVRELESQLAEMATYEPPDITAEEFKAYQKVSQALSAVACRGCGRACIALATAADPAMAMVACRGCRAVGCRTACIMAAGEDFVTQAVAPCACGGCRAVGCRGCYSACIAAAADEGGVGVEAAAMPCGGCRAAACRGSCYACIGYEAGTNERPDRMHPAITPRRGLRRFAGLGGE